MNVLSAAILIGLTASVILGSIYFRVWLGRRDLRAYLIVSIGAFASAACAAFELSLMAASSPHVYAELVRWMHVPVSLVFFATLFFIRSSLDAGRLWLMYSAIGVRCAALLINFILPLNLNFSSLTEIRKVNILGELASVPVGTTSAWMLLAHLSTILILVFCIDAAITVYRRGEERTAITIGGCAVVFFGIGGIVNGLSNLGAIDWPVTSSLFASALIFGMGFEIASEVLRSKGLAAELDSTKLEAAETFEALAIASDAGNVGVWMRNLETDEVWASDKLREIFGFSKEEELTRELFLKKIDPSDREKARQLLRDAMAAGSFSTEFRLQLEGGATRWVASRGRLTGSSGPRILYGAIADITKQKLAQLAEHHLGSRLIKAQEQERARLARELHDDLSQNLALLSIKLEMLGAGEANFEARINEMSAQIQTLSSDVHRISHELHPAKLEQLGLAAAVRGFCREVEEARGLKIELDQQFMRNVPKDVSLCVYRVIQEGLQNVVKHSGSTSAKVVIKEDRDMLRLIIQDKGVGFDPTGPAGNSLGLTSMRERILSVSGTLVFDTSVGAGTRIDATIPLGPAVPAIIH